MVANKVKATPAARNQARKGNIELDRLIGSGENGRIHLVDVLNYIENNKVKATPLAKRIANNIEQIEGVKVPVGYVDISLYRV